VDRAHCDTPRVPVLLSGCLGSRTQPFDMNALASKAGAGTTRRTEGAEQSTTPDLGQPVVVPLEQFTDLSERAMRVAAVSATEPSAGQLLAAWPTSDPDSRLYSIVTGEHAVHAAVPGSLEFTGEHAEALHHLDEEIAQARDEWETTRADPSQVRRAISALPSAIATSSRSLAADTPSPPPTFGTVRRVDSLGRGFDLSPSHVPTPGEMALSRRRVSGAFEFQSSSPEDRTSTPSGVPRHASTTTAASTTRSSPPANNNSSQGTISSPLHRSPPKHSVQLALIQSTLTRVVAATQRMAEMQVTLTDRIRHLEDRLSEKESAHPALPSTLAVICQSLHERGSLAVDSIEWRRGSAALGAYLASQDSSSLKDGLPLAEQCLLTMLWELGPSLCSSAGLSPPPALPVPRKLLTDVGGVHVGWVAASVIPDGSFKDEVVRRQQALAHAIQCLRQGRQWPWQSDRPPPDPPSLLPPTMRLDWAPLLCCVTHVQDSTSLASSFDTSVMSVSQLELPNPVAILRELQSLGQRRRLRRAEVVERGFGQASHRVNLFRKASKVSGYFRLRKTVVDPGVSTTGDEMSKSVTPGRRRFGGTLGGRDSEADMLASKRSVTGTTVDGDDYDNETGVMDAGDGMSATGTIEEDTDESASSHSEDDSHTARHVDHTDDRMSASGRARDEASQVLRLLCGPHHVSLIFDSQSQRDAMARAVQDASEASQQLHNIRRRLSHRRQLRSALKRSQSMSRKEMTSVVAASTASPEADGYASDPEEATKEREAVAMWSKVLENAAAVEAVALKRTTAADAASTPTKWVRRLISINAATETIEHRKVALLGDLFVVPNLTVWAGEAGSRGSNCSTAWRALAGRPPSHAEASVGGGGSGLFAVGIEGFSATNRRPVKLSPTRWWISGANQDESLQWNRLLSAVSMG
jgi:hypothetical protein